MTEQIPEQFSLNAYSYHLPAEQIAQYPAERRDHSRLMVLNQDNSLSHTSFSHIVDYIQPDDLLIVNNTKVFPARLTGKKQTGGKVEVFLLEYPCGQDDTVFFAKALLKASKRPKEGAEIEISRSISCLVKRHLDGGKVELEIHCKKREELQQHLQSNGQIPLPPYITRENGASEEDRKRYQTVYAQIPGAVAAPTAGLHFTEELLQKIADKGAQTAAITLHVGYGTFAPVRHEDIRCHEIHSEYIDIPQQTVAAVEKAKKQGRQIWAVGTTAVRALEYGAATTGKLQATSGWCNLYIYPGFTFNVVDSMITNFHLPNSSLLFLVSAFCGAANGREILLKSYQQAVEQGYRFFSYGDAMAIPGPRR